MIFATIYGATGGHDDETAAQQTEDIISAILEELSDKDMVPTGLLDELNAEPENRPTTVDMPNSRSWTDLGAVAGVWGQECGTPT